MKFECNLCGSREGKSTSVTQMFLIDDRPLIVEDVPSVVCIRCGEAIFDIATVEKIRRMVHGNVKPIKSITTDVFDFAQ